ncbi:MAG: phosphate ABC transporter substrate-binding protein [Candidatus Omnitrophica bacterium]|nr:phosphate ABC transporter substrate-binding protein [Candidatus Omnitrophota bacterium]
MAPRYARVMAMAFAAFLAASIAMAADEMVQIKGSDTLINMVQRLAEVYMEKRPSTAIAVTGGGSGTGIAALINRKCDIANASRTIKPKEVMDANSKGVDPKRIVVAIDALSIVTNTSNPVKKLTIAQIGKIYKGEITNWKEVGGNDARIALYGRQSNSGTYDFMKEVVMEGEYSPSLKSMNGNAQIVEAIKQDATGIGYVGVGYARDAAGSVNVVKVAKDHSAGYFGPFNVADVKSGRYPITRPLNQYVNGAPSGAAKRFLMFELSDEGQSIVEKEGFFPVPDEYRKYNESTLGSSLGFPADNPESRDPNEGAG